MNTKERDRLKVLHEVKQGTFHARGGGAAVRDNGPLGEEVAGTGEEGRRRRSRASAAGPGVESALAGESARQGAEAGEGASTVTLAPRWPASTWRKMTRWR